MSAYGTYTDQELIVRLRRGDAAAFTEIFKRYQSLLYVFAYKKIGDREEAKDLIHEMFAGVWEKRDVLHVPGDLAAYLYTVLKNRIFDIYKHKKVTQRYLDTFQTYLDAEPAAADFRVRHNDLAALIDREIAALPPKMRQVFELSRKTNLNRKEISELLEVSEETVKSRMYNALKILKGRLGSLVGIGFFLF